MIVISISEALASVEDHVTLTGELWPYHVLERYVENLWTNSPEREKENPNLDSVQDMPGIPIISQWSLVSGSITTEIMG